MFGWGGSDEGGCGAGEAVTLGKNKCHKDHTATQSLLGTCIEPVYRCVILEGVSTFFFVTQIGLWFRCASMVQ